MNNSSSMAHPCQKEANFSVKAAIREKYSAYKNIAFHCSFALKVIQRNSNVTLKSSQKSTMITQLCL